MWKPCSSQSGSVPLFARSCEEELGTYVVSQSALSDDNVSTNPLLNVLTPFPVLIPGNPSGASKL